MSTFRERKDARTDHFLRFVSGWKECPCGACAGSGHYDHDGSPDCGACGGSGTERTKPAAPPVPNHFRRPIGETLVEQRRFDLRYFSQPGIHIPKYRHDLQYLHPLVAAERERLSGEAKSAYLARRTSNAPGM